MPLGSNKEERFKSSLKSREGVRFSDKGRKIIPKEESLIIKGSASFDSWNYEACILSSESC